jgi:excisionase family DNA binding protein
MLVPSPWLTADEAAAYARCHKPTIYQACAVHDLTHVKLNGKKNLLLRTEWIDAWIERGRVTADQELAGQTGPMVGLRPANAACR